MGTYTNAQLFESAKIAGLKLYGEPVDENGFNSGLIWANEERVAHVNENQIPEVPEDWNGDDDFSDAGDAYPFTDDYEYQFHPSSNTGVDCAGDYICKLKPDVDGNIYIYYPETGIRVIHTNNDYCEHDWQEQPGEPPIDICPKCGNVRR